MEHILAGCGRGWDCRHGGTLALGAGLGDRPELRLELIGYDKRTADNRPDRIGLVVQYLLGPWLRMGSGSSSESEGLDGDICDVELFRIVGSNTSNRATKS